MTRQLKLIIEGLVLISLAWGLTQIIYPDNSAKKQNIAARTANF